MIRQLQPISAGLRLGGYRRIAVDLDEIIERIVEARDVEISRSNDAIPLLIDTGQDAELHNFPVESAGDRNVKP